MSKIKLFILIIAILIMVIFIVYKPIDKASIKEELKSITLQKLIQNIKNENCIQILPQDVKIKYINGTIKIIDGEIKIGLTPKNNNSCD